VEARHARRVGGEVGLSPEVLRGADLALRHKLRRRFSAHFVDRQSDDLLAQAAKEYAVALERGDAIHNPGGFIVDVGYKRALDALGKEKRTPALDDIDEAISLADPHSPQPLQELEQKEERSQLYEAVSHLEPEERRVIALVFFEGLSGREAARPLGTSESTSLRRLRSAQTKLREWLPAIEEGRFCEEAAPQLRAFSEGIASDQQRIQAGLHLRNCASCRDALARHQEFAFEAGLVAWLAAIADHPHGASVADQAIAVADQVKEWFSGWWGRARDFAFRLLSSGGGDAVAGPSGAPLAKTVAVCGTAVVCAVTGVVGPGVGGVNVIGGRHDASHLRPLRQPERRRTSVPTANRTPPAASPRPVTSEQAPSPKPAGSSRQGHESHSGSSISTSTPPTNAATSQFGIESQPAPAAPAPTPEPVVPQGETPSQAAGDQFALP